MLNGERKLCFWRNIEPEFSSVSRRFSGDLERNRRVPALAIFLRPLAFLWQCFLNENHDSFVPPVLN